MTSESPPGSTRSAQTPSSVGANSWAILSLALAIGACISAFRLIDALLLRPLPVAHPERLFALSYVEIGPDGKPRASDSCDYPMFRQMRTAVTDQAELLAISFAARMDLTYGSDPEMEKAYRQFVSGRVFGSFGLRPALGRLFTETDDLQSRARPYAVLSHDYWTRRFGRDPKVIGRTFQMSSHLYQIIGVAEEGFTGTETGVVTDILRSHGDASRGFRFRLELVPDLGAAEAGRCRRTASRQTERNVSSIPPGEGEGTYRTAQTEP